MKIDRWISSLQPNCKRKMKVRALVELSILGAKAKSAVPDILPLLNDNDAEVRMAAMVAIRDILGRNAEPHANAALSDPDPTVRACAASALIKFGFKSAAYPIFRQMMLSDDQLEREGALRFVNYLGKDYSLEKISSAELASSVPVNDTQTIVLNCPICDELEVTIGMCGGESLTPIQEKALALIRKLSAKVVKAVFRELLLRFEEEGHGVELDDDEIEVNIQSAVMPPLKESSDAYFFLCGDSDYDIEHGFACLFKNHDEFCVCDSDQARAAFLCDDIASLEEILNASHIVSLK